MIHFCLLHLTLHKIRIPLEKGAERLKNFIALGMSEEQRGNRPKRRKLGSHGGSGQNAYDVMTALKSWGLVGAAGRLLKSREPELWEQVFLLGGTRWPYVIRFKSQLPWRSMALRPHSCLLRSFDSFPFSVCGWPTFWLLFFVVIFEPRFEVDGLSCRQILGRWQLRAVGIPGEREEVRLVWRQLNLNFRNHHT